MQTVAVVASWVAFAACLTTALVYGVVLRFERDNYGRHVMAGMLAVSALLGLVIVLVADRETDAIYFAVTALMCIVVALAAWRIAMILRRPKTDEDVR